MVPGDNPPVNNPTWLQVEAALGKLTGEETENSVYLFKEYGEPPYLQVTGETGYYMVEFFDENSYMLINPAQEDSDEEIEIAGFGIINDFPVREVVSLDMAIQAAKTFFENGQQDPSSVWK